MWKLNSNKYFVAIHYNFCQWCCFRRQTSPGSQNEFSVSYCAAGSQPLWLQFLSFLTLNWYLKLVNKFRMDLKIFLCTNHSKYWITLELWVCYRQASENEGFKSPFMLDLSLYGRCARHPRHWHGFWCRWCRCSLCPACPSGLGEIFMGNEI